MTFVIFVQFLGGTPDRPLQRNGQGLAASEQAMVADCIDATPVANSQRRPERNDGCQDVALLPSQRNGAPCELPGVFRLQEVDRIEQALKYLQALIRRDLGGIQRFNFLEQPAL